MRFLKLFLATLVCAVCASAQEPDITTLNVDARNVSVSVNVVDSSGRPVLKLKKDDFSILEDGEPQEIQAFESVEVPYSILILVDCSASTEADWPLMRNAIDRFAAKLRSQDRVSVAQFGSKVDTLMDWQPWVGDSFGVTIHSESRNCGGTDYYGAVENVVGRFKGITGRKGVVVLTDGIQVPFPVQSMKVGDRSVRRVSDSVDDKGFQSTLQVVSRSEIVFYFLAVNTDLNPDAVSHGVYNPDLIYNMQQARSRMQQLAEASGGRIEFPKKPSEVAPLYEEIARDFGTNYGLWYSPTKPAGAAETRPRKIEVHVNTPGVTVKLSRDTYSPLSK